MLDRDKKEIIELLEMILDSIDVIQDRTGHMIRKLKEHCSVITRKSLGSM